MDTFLINVVDLGDNPEVGAPMSVLAPQDPEALPVPRLGNPPYYDYEYEGMPRSFGDYTFEPMAFDSPMRELRDYELVNPQELPSTRQNSLDSQESDTSGDHSQDSRDSGSQNSTSDISEYEMLDDMAEEPDLEAYLNRPSTNRLRRQWTTGVGSTLMIPGPAVDDDECSINSSDTYTADWDKTRTPSSIATPTASCRPVTGKRGSDGDIDLDRGEGPSRRQAPARRSSVPYKRQRFSQ